MSRRRKTRRLTVGDLVRVNLLWNSEVSDWDASDAVGIVMGVNESDDLEGIRLYGHTPENTLITVLVNGDVLEDEYYESDISLAE